MPVFEKFFDSIAGEIYTIRMISNSKKSHYLRFVDSDFFFSNPTFLRQFWPFVKLIYCF